MSRVPDWTLRNCAAPGCTSYGRTHCHAWDLDANAPCHAPLCELHAWRAGSLRFCPRHRTGSAGVPVPNQPINQGGLFDPPEY